MTTNNHTAITTGAAANASTVNTPLGQLDSKMGNVSALTTTTTTSLVAAVDELHGEHGTLSSLTTTAKTNFVAAINEVDANADTAQSTANTANTSIGTLASLLTTAKTNLVAAINEVIGYIGTLASLTTTAKSSTVAAINELDGEIGTLSSLTTGVNSTIVGAINWLHALVGNYVNVPVITVASASTLTLTEGKRIYRISGGTNISTITPTSSVGQLIYLINIGSWDLVTGGNISRTYIPASGEVVTLIYDDTASLWRFPTEDPSLLNTTANGSLVDAINEVDTNADAAGSNASTALTRIGTLGSLTTVAQSNLVAAVNEVDSNADTATVLASWNNAAVVNKTGASTLTLNSGVARYNVSGTTAISTINWSAGIPTVIYLMDSGLGQMNIFYDDGNIVGAGLSGENTHGTYAVVCLVYNAGNWQKVI